MTDTAPETMNFEDFRRAVGGSEYSVRIALAALHLAPEAKGRRVLYKREWVAQVKDYIAKAR